jgi:hypothetical protein
VPSQEEVIFPATPHTPAKRPHFSEASAPSALAPRTSAKPLHLLRQFPALSAKPPRTLCVSPPAPSA